MGLEFIIGFALVMLSAFGGIAYWINSAAAKALPAAGKVAQEVQQLPDLAILPKYVQDMLAQKQAMVEVLPSAIEALKALQIVNRRLAAVNAKETDPQYAKEVNSLAAQLIKEPVA